MQVCEENLPPSQEFPLSRQRLLDLNDHVSEREDWFWAFAERGACGSIFCIREARAYSGTSFHDHLVSMVDELGDRGRDQPDAILVVFHLLWHPDLHAFFSLRPLIFRRARDSAR